MMAVDTGKSILAHMTGMGEDHRTGVDFDGIDVFKTVLEDLGDIVGGIG